MSDDMDVETPAQPRTSRFKEHTNTASSIKPPPDELWKDIAIDDMIERFNTENQAPPKQKSKSISPPVFGVPAASCPAHTTTAESATSGTSEGTLGRFSRAWASVFGGLGGVLGKRKAGTADAERERERERLVLDERKQAAEQAYEARKLAQEQGLLPTPKVFVRPTATPRGHRCVVDHTPLAATPRTPTLYKSPSKKDLHKQKKLARRVSDLEHKLASARKELRTVLDKDAPPVPPLPIVLPPTPTPESSQSQTFSDKENDTSQDTNATSPAPSQKSHVGVGKITKKRKAVADADADDDDANDKDYKPIATDTDTDGDIDMATSASEHESTTPQSPHRNIKRQKSTTSPAKTTTKRKTARLTKRISKGEIQSRREKSEEIVVRVVPDGKKVPPVPAVPVGVKGKKVKVKGEDGYGGLEHEMF